MVNKKNTNNPKEFRKNMDSVILEHERKEKKLEEKVELEKELDEEGTKDLEEDSKIEQDSKKIDDLTEEEKARLAEEEEDNKTRYLRLAADFANYKKRSENEKSKIHAYANEKLVTDMLDVLDNFDRAFLQEGSESDSFVEGMVLIYKQLLDVLQKSGLSEINAEGEPFNPEFHNALMMEDSKDCKSGDVTEVFKKGYMMNKKVIRPTLVKVAQ